MALTRSRFAFANVVALFAVLAGAGCTPPAPKLPAFTQANATVSVLGVFRAGRMSSDTWRYAARGLSSGLGGTCQAAYSEATARENAELYAAVDEATRAEGISEDVLEKMAPAATGDLILAVIVHDKAARSIVDNGLPPAHVAAGPGGRGGPQRSDQGIPRTYTEAAAVELVGVIYSKALRRTVAKVSARATLAAMDDAVKALSDSLRPILPSAACGTWTKLGADAAPPGAGG